MTEIMTGIGVGAGVFVLCAVLRWLPAGGVGKLLLLGYFAVLGGWTGLSWSRLSDEVNAAAKDLSPARFESAMEEAWPAPRPEKVTAEEIERVMREVTEKVAAGALPPGEVQALQEASRAMIGDKRLIDRGGYAATSEVEVFMTDVLPLRLRDRVAQRFPQKRTRLFGYGCLLALLGVAAGGLSAAPWRRAQQEPADA